MGRLEEAKQHLEAALRLRPAYEEAHRNLEEILTITSQKQMPSEDDANLGD